MFKMERQKLLLFLLLTISVSLFAQSDSGKISLLRFQEIKTDSANFHSFVILNNTDSFVCILHSIWNYFDTDFPQTLPIWNCNSKTNVYHFVLSEIDLKITGERINYKSIILSPHSAKHFKIVFHKWENRKINKLQFDYISFSNVCLKEFEEQQTDFLWYRKYNLQTFKVVLK